MLLWHMHQPFYKDLAEGLYAMPWVRLHAMKDYYGMAAILKEFPSVHVTFNMVPSLVLQLEEYARDAAREEAYDIAFKPAEDLAVTERRKLLGFAFQINRENLLNRYPRFRELHEKARSAQPEMAARLFTTQDWLDVQLLSQLAWFDEIYLAEDAEIRRLVAKGHGFSEDDKALLRKKTVQICNEVLDVLRQLSLAGQIELSTSPFFHPILPLLCNTDIAADSHPGIRLPRRAFRHPEDARDQLRAAVDYHTKVFGSRPGGLWPSEGSISDQVLQMAAEEGFAWAASDEGVLSRSLQVGFFRHADGTVSNGHQLYRPHRFLAGDREISLFFRDHQLSDLIGFVYSHMDAPAAAADLHERIRAAARSTGPQPAVVSIILDGENAWEFYPRNGRDFLKTFYQRISQDPEVRAVTASEALAVAEPGVLTHVVPGSWINANFDVWIGPEEDNRAWDLLTDARDFYAQNCGRPDIDPEKSRLAQQELWIAEGSDWCWWYGPEHSTANDEEFDLLFRKHLSNVYRLLGGSPPDELAVPIKRPRARSVTVPPTGHIQPRIDGEATTYFEWLGSGVYAPDYRSGSMHGGERAIEAFYFGCGEQSIFLRLDLHRAFLAAHSAFEIRVIIDGESRARLHASISEGRVSLVQFWNPEGQLLVPLATKGQLEVAFVRIFEARLDQALLGVGPCDKARLQVSLWVSDLPVQVIPPEGWLALELAEDLASW